MARRIALLRGINVGGRSIVPMAALRELCAGVGWSDVETFIQSGNVVFEAKGGRENLERALEEALESRFGFRPTVIVRSGAEWAEMLAANPFPTEAKEEPGLVHVGIPKAPLPPDAAAAIEKGAAGERVREAGGALWFHYPNGAGRSKITPSVIDKAAGSPVTARNWRTALTLGEMAG